MSCTGSFDMGLTSAEGQKLDRVFDMNVEGVTLVLPSRLFMFNKYWRILALS